MEMIEIRRRPSEPLSFSLSASRSGAGFGGTESRWAVDTQIGREDPTRHDCPLNDAAFPRPILAARLADAPIYAATPIRAQGPSVISMAPESVNAGSVGVDMQQQGTGVSGLAQVVRQGGARGVPPRGRPDC